MLAQAATPDAPADAVASGWQAIVEADGLGISITGMLIVFVALTAISVFIGLLPKILGVLEPYLPEVGHHAAPDPAAGTAKPTAGTDPRMVAAIAWARHQDGK
ncbi:MAG: OadG family protein [Planctomycetota bacterium]